MNIKLNLEDKMLNPGVINLRQFTSGADTLVFLMPDYIYETTDLSKLDCYAICDMPVTEEDYRINETKLVTEVVDNVLRIKWNITGYTTAKEGTITYQIVFKDKINMQTKIWISDKAIIFVNSSLNVDGMIPAMFPDILMQWEERMEQMDIGIQERQNWKEATCTENATYQANIKNWGTVVNSLLAITFASALDKTKEVILKINDEQAYPILSNNEPMLGEELENKSTILRFDGTSWLVQTSQSGTVQSSDKSVKDIVTVTRKELKQLQASGQLVEGTMYQTEESAEDVTSITEELYLLKNNLSNPNLLINSDFRNPINQRGQTTWNTTSYMIDRWIDLGGYDNLITLTENGLLFNVQDTLCVIEQRTEERHEIGDIFTVTLEMDNVIKSVTIKCVSTEERNEMNFFDDTQEVGVSFYRTISPTANITTLRIIVYKDELTISRVKLEQGSIATPFVPRHYAEELALCERYFLVYDMQHMPLMLSSNGAIAIFSIDNVKLRRLPHLNITYPFALNVRTNGSETIVNATALNVTILKENKFIFSFNLDRTTVKHSVAYTSTEKKLLFDAEIY